MFLPIVREILDGKTQDIAGESVFAQELPQSKWLLPPGLDLFAYGLAEGSFLYGRSMSEQPLSRMLPRP